jgi:hypothetical protein
MRFFNCSNSLFAGYDWILFQELVQRLSAFQILDQDLEGHASPAKNRFATENILVPDDCALHLRPLSAYRLRAARYTFHGSQ